MWRHIVTDSAFLPYTLLFPNALRMRYSNVQTPRTQISQTNVCNSKHFNIKLLRRTSKKCAAKSAPNYAKNRENRGENRVFWPTKDASFPTERGSFPHENSLLSPRKHQNIQLFAHSIPLCKHRMPENQCILEKTKCNALIKIALRFDYCLHPQFKPSIIKIMFPIVKKVQKITVNRYDSPIFLLPLSPITSKRIP